MVTIEKVEKKDFSAEDLDQTKVGFLLSKIGENTPCYAAKFNTDLIKFVELGLKYTEEFVVFNLMNDNKMINFEKKSFPFVYNTSEESTIITVKPDGEIMYSEDTEDAVFGKSFFLKYDDPEYNYTGFINRTFNPYELIFYLNSEASVETKCVIDDIISISETIVEGTENVNINLDHIMFNSAMFEYLLIFPRYSNISPLLYGYLTVDDTIYRITGGDYCGKNL